MNDNVTEDNHSIQLVVQYYHCHDHARQNELDTCLCMNLENPAISKVHLLTEEFFDLTSYPCHEKIIQTVINERLTYNYAFNYVNKIDPLSKCIWILSNADIYFDETLRFLEWANLDRVVYALTRYDVQDDGSLKSIPSALAHGCQDVWIFRAPVLVDKMFSSFCLGIAGCDHRIAYEFTEIGCAVVNPSLTLIAYHLDLSRQKDIHVKTKEYAGWMTEEGYRLGKVVPPPYLYCIYPSAQLAYPDVALVRHHVLSESKAFQRENELLELIDAERHQVTAKEERIAILEHGIVAMERENYNNNVLLQELEMRSVSQAKRIVDLENSFSWRVTSPLRAFHRGLFTLIARFFR